jgi:hypothetical protein
MRENRVETDTLAAFGYSERLLVRSLRRIASGKGCCPFISREVAALCGEEALEVVATCGTFLQALSFAGRRRLTFAKPGSAGITPDERQLLELVAATQAGRTELFEAHLRWLARPERRPVLKIAAGAVATAFAVNELRFAPPRMAAPAARTRVLALV